MLVVDSGIVLMRFFLLLIFSAGVGLAARVTPSEWAGFYELVVPFATVLVIIGGWRWASLLRKLALLTLALVVGWFADWGLHAIIHRPDSAFAMRASLILFGIRLAIGIWLLIPAHFGCKDKHSPRVTAFEMDAIVGISRGFGIGCGVVAGVVLCKAHGVLAVVGGAVGGVIVGFFVGTVFGYASTFVGALAGILAKIYWEVLTGRRKLPDISSTTKAHRRLMFRLLAIIFVVTTILWAGIYFAGTNAQRSRVLGLAGWAFGTISIGLVILIVRYRRCPARNEDGMQTTLQNVLQEFSTNFDSKMVRPFLERIQPFIESGFGSAQIEQVCQVVAALPHDQERILEFQIRYAGEDAKFEVHIFMDDIDAPDIYFFASAPLREQIESEFHRFAEERGI